MDQNQLLQQGQNYANQFAQNYASVINPNVTPFSHIAPFSSFFNPDYVGSSLHTSLGSYYDNLLKNYQDLQGIYQKQTQNTYDTTKPYLTQSQQNYLNYNSTSNAYNAQRLAGQYQGNGTGSSSMARLAQGNLHAQNTYDVGQQTLQNSKDLSDVQNTYDTSTALNKQQTKQQTQEYGTQYNQDYNNAYNQAYQNALTAYNTAQNAYNTNNNYNAEGYGGSFHY